MIANECHCCDNKHVFCHSCILAWSMTFGENSQKCPFCRYCMNAHTLECCLSVITLLNTILIIIMNIEHHYITLLYYVIIKVLHIEHHYITLLYYVIIKVLPYSQGHADLAPRQPAHMWHTAVNSHKHKGKLLLLSATPGGSTLAAICHLPVGCYQISLLSDRGSCMDNFHRDVAWWWNHSGSNP